MHFGVAHPPSEALMSAQFDLIDVVLFVNIAETNSLTHGAGRSYISVPAASTRIKHIEARLGAKLLDRTTRGVTLTPAGQAFLHHGRQFVSQLHYLQADLREYSQGTKGYVRLFANTNATSEFLPSVLRDYLISHPNVNVDLREHLSHDIVQAVSEGIADLGIIAGNERTDGLEVLPYRRDRLVLIVAHAHALAKVQRVGFEETLDCDYVGLLEASAIQSFLSQAASALRKSLKLRIQVSNFEALGRMVEANVGIGIMPKSAACRHEKNMGIRIVQLSNDWARRDLKICVRNRLQLPLFAQDLVDLLIADSKSCDFPSSLSHLAPLRIGA
jgi:DNA-binding transcriptional LysR family regulator